MKRGLMVLYDHFEDGEALVTRDLLIRAGMKVDTVSAYNKKEVKSAHDLTIITDYKINDDIDLESYDFLIISGGSYVSEILDNNKEEIISSLAKKYNNDQKLVAAICAGPRFLDKAGLLDGKNFTCFPSCEEGINGKYHINKKVVKEDNIITAKALGAVFDFSLKIVEYLLGKDAKQKLINEIYY